MSERRINQLVSILIALLIVQAVPEIANLATRSAYASEAAFTADNTPIVSTYDETWEATEFLAHDLGPDVEFRNTGQQLGDDGVFVADVTQKYLDRNAAMKSRVIWRKLAGNATVLTTLFPTKWKVTGHIHAQ